MIEILTKIHAKITIIVLENREHYYFIIICNCKYVLLYLFSYQIWLLPQERILVGPSHTLAMATA